MYLIMHYLALGLATIFVGSFSIFFILFYSSIVYMLFNSIDNYMQTIELAIQITAIACVILVFILGIGKLIDIFINMLIVGGYIIC